MQSAELLAHGCVHLLTRIAVLFAFFIVAGVTETWSWSRWRGREWRRQGAPLGAGFWDFVGRGI